MKTLSCATPVLAAPHLDQPFKLEVDASHVWAGVALLQEREGVDRCVCYLLKKFNSYQPNYSTIEKDTLALVWALEHFEVYVGSGGGPVVVYTDYSPLTFLCSLSCPNYRLMRWTLNISKARIKPRRMLFLSAALKSFNAAK